MAASLSLSGRSSRARFLTLKYSAASMCGFATDLTLLKLLTHAGMSPAWARVISLFTAMQVTFCINGFFVFRSIEARRVHRQWAAYMATNALGNLCNYLVFTTLLSLHRPVLSNHVVAVCVGAFTAWMVNYGFTRMVVFNPRLHLWTDTLAKGLRRVENLRTAASSGRTADSAASRAMQQTLER